MRMVKTTEQLDNEITLLHSKLEDANYTLDAIRTGQADALVVMDQNGHKSFTLKILADLSAQKESKRQLKMKNTELKEAYKITAKLNSELEHIVKERTEELLISNQNFKSLADHIPAMVWTCLGNGEVNYYNKKWYEYSGKTFEKTRDWKDVIHPDDFEYTLTAWNTAIKRGLFMRQILELKELLMALIAGISLMPRLLKIMRTK